MHGWRANPPTTKRKSHKVSSVMEEEPAWANQYKLKVRGTYYEGFVEELDSLLTKFKAETVTTFGVRRSRYIDGNSVDRIREPTDDQENIKVLHKQTYIHHTIMKYSAGGILK